MSEDTKQGGQSDAAEFDLQLELSSLVADQIIPQSIAEKLEQKLVEKQVDITKDQLYALAEKIHSLIQTYKETGSLPNPTENSVESSASVENDQVDSATDEEIDSSEVSTGSDSVDDQSVSEFMEKIEELQQKIDMLEEEKQNGFADEGQGSDQQPRQEARDDEFQLPYDESVSTKHLTTDPLESIPTNPESIIVLMNWLQYLVNRCGHENLAHVLDYYVDVDWISDDVKISLLEYATGITEGKDTTEGSKKNSDKSSDLPSKDHIQSYMYIQRLKGKKFEKHFVERINGELARIEKKVDTYHHKQ
ncbi:MAG: hypothetical protein KGY65_05475 [Candidatus Thermoplasmatota archaeon]|nr:hypothetical protein [Candidatus Thermoplasmatota archaeon]MBS3802182.1 hypothetical protein [Candidatus Thermoplasmatota archaeon]